MARDMAGRGPTVWCFFKRRAVALAGDDDDRVWWPVVAQDESDQLATPSPGGEDEARVRVHALARIWQGG